MEVLSIEQEMMEEEIFSGAEVEALMPHVGTEQQVIQVERQHSEHPITEPEVLTCGASLCPEVANHIASMPMELRSNSLYGDCPEELLAGGGETCTRHITDRKLSGSSACCGLGKGITVIGD
ncbi:hypothetical protein Tsubulata_006795 [Turnera subulata]|uniref:Uncharacterized protein n=1 Tax=Turnera subulata TaxID=218843 RepID=A0A9Q0JJL9_9ROSI|nr:hypothetical protein Tsubulata_006795 [Turnera subulata]